MSAILGTNVAAPVVPFTTDDNYATHDEKYGKGGWRRVNTYADLASIPAERRSDGMAVFVRDSGLVYLYKAVGDTFELFTNFNNFLSTLVFATWAEADGYHAAHPDVTMEDSFGARVIADPDAQHIDPVSSTLVDNNGIYRWNSSVSAFQRMGNLEVVDASGILDNTIAAKDLAVAAKAETQNLLGDAREELETTLAGITIRPGGATIDGIQALATIGALNAAGAFVDYISLMPDGIHSPPIDNLINAEMGGFKLEISGIVGFKFAITMVDAEGVSRIVAGRRDDGSWYPSSGGGSEPETGTRTIYHLTKLGQSNNAADGSTPIISSTASPWGNLRPAMGTKTHIVGVHNTDPENRDPANFVPVALNESGVETSATGFADTLKMLLLGLFRHSTPVSSGDSVLVTNASTGSRRLADLGPINDKGEGQYATLIDDVRQIKAAVEALGWNYVYLGCHYDQGEKEGDLKLTDGGSVLSRSALIAGYLAEAIDFVEQHDADARAETGQTDPIKVFVTPASSHTLTSEAWAQAAEQSSLIRIVGGRSIFQSALHNNFSDTAQSIHYSPDSHRTDIGERLAHAVFEDFFKGEPKFAPVLIGAEKVDETTVRMLTNARWPLMVDDVTMPPPRNHGFTLQNGTIDAPTGTQHATGVVPDPDNPFAVLATFTSIPAGAFVVCSSESITAIAVPNVSAVDSVTVEGESGFSVTVADDLSEALAPLIDLGHFFLYGAGAATSQGVIRWVEYDGANTILTGRVAELRTGGSYTAFQAGQTLRIGHTTGYSNIRDTNPAKSRTAYAQGARAGRYPHLGNYMTGRIGVPVQGA